MQSYRVESPRDSEESEEDYKEPLLATIDINDGIDNESRIDLKAAGIEPPSSMTKPFKEMITGQAKKKIKHTVTDDKYIKIDIAERVLEFLHSGQNPDVTLTIDNFKLPCHYIVLKSYSKFCRCLPNNSVIPITATDIEPATLELVYNWMLNDHVVIPNEMVVKVLRCALYLDISELLSQCWARLEKLCEFRAFAIIYESQDVKGLSILHSVMLPRIRKSYLTIFASKEFLLLNEEILTLLLKNDCAGVNSEVEIFYAALMWLDHNWPERISATFRILECVRYSHMSPITLNYLLMTQTGKIGPHKKPLDVFLSSVRHTKMIKDGLCYTGNLIPSNTMTDLMQRLKKCNLEFVQQRRWIFDPQCEYHKDLRLGRPNITYISYPEYHAYLKGITKRHDFKLKLVRDAEIC